LKRQGLEGEGFGSERLVREGLKGICLGFSLTKETSTVDFTVPTAVALLNKKKV
jgi:hypothetical protein